MGYVNKHTGRQGKQVHTEAKLVYLFTCIPPLHNICTIF